VRAFVISAADDQVATTVRNDLPVPDGDDVTVAVEWSGINYKDAMVVAPSSRVRRSSTLIGGVDAAGTVVASNATDIAVGDRVVVHGGDIGVGRDGGFSEFISVPRRFVNVLPNSLTTREAMVVGTAGYTAFASLIALEQRGLKPSDGEVLVTGATGGVGSWSVVALSAAGYSVVGSTGSRDAQQWLLEMGATRCIGRDEIGDKPDRVLGSELWAGAIDCVGGDTLHQVLRTLSYGAGVAASGLVASADLATNVYPFITRNVALLGIDAVNASPETRTSVWDLVTNTMLTRAFEPLIASIVTLEEIDGALALIAQGQTRGRILVDTRA
jgi:putative YhdH/YhfP family quinone oxidoreductase